MIDGNDVYVPNRSGLSFHDIFVWGGGGVGVLYRVLVLTQVTPDYN